VNTNYNTELRLPSISDVKAAEDRIRSHVHRTPVLQSRTLNLLSNATLFFKCENFQRGGAFKARGAHNAVLALSDEEAQRGVVTHSSGNHGAAIALAAQSRGISAHIVVPENSVQIKIDNILRLGANVVTCKPTLEERKASAVMVSERTGAYPIHSYDNSLVIAGQGTAAAELLADKADLDTIIAPVGGGGLLSGTALAAKGVRPDITIVGAEPEMADDALRSFREGRLINQNNPQTIADGLRVSLSPLTFKLIRNYVDDIVPVSEADIVKAMRIIWSVLKIVVEPSAAVPLAAILGNSSKPIFARKRIGVILSGGNVDLDRLPW
jgi:threonine dehydratase